MFAVLSKFIIADLSQPRSTPLESLLTVSQIATPRAPIIRAGDQAFSMFTALWRKYNWRLPVVRYRSTPGLTRRLKTCIIDLAKVISKRLRARKHSNKHAR